MPGSLIRLFMSAAAGAALAAAIVIPAARAPLLERLTEIQAERAAEAEARTDALREHLERTTGLAETTATTLADIYELAGEIGGNVTALQTRIEIGAAATAARERTERHASDDPAGCIVRSIGDGMRDEIAADRDRYRRIGGGD